MLKKSQAFTMIEVLTALSIILIFTMIALPQINQLFVSNQDEVLLSQLQDTIQIAIQAAYAKNTAVVMCQSEHHFICDSKQQKRWVIFFDENHDGMMHNQHQQFAVIQLKFNQRNTLHWRLFPIRRLYLLFNPEDTLHSSNGTFWYCHFDDLSPVWALIMNQSGRVRIVRRDRYGNIIDAEGKILHC